MAKEGASLQVLELDEVREIEMSILDEIARVCQQLDLQYQLAFGSLIGAMRHQGFIPWDDDMDITLLRPDYEVLVERFNEVKQVPQYELLLYRDGKSPLPFAKVVDTSTVVRMHYVKEECDTGVWVDVFPLDYIQGDRPPLLLRERMYHLIRSTAVAKSDPSRPVWKNLILGMASAVLSAVDPIKISAKHDVLAQSYANGPQKYVCDMVGEPFTRKRYETDWFEPIMVPFESRMYAVPKGYEEVLSTDYGDWRTLPPEEERMVHSMGAYRLD